MTEPIRHLLERTAREGHVTYAALMSRSKTKAVARARHRAMALLRNSTEMSYPEIARVFGRDHTTVMYGVARYERGLR